MQITSVKIFRDYRGARRGRQDAARTSQAGVNTCRRSVRRILIRIGRRRFGGLLIFAGEAGGLMK